MSQIFSWFNKSVKLDFGHLLKLPPPFFPRCFQMETMCSKFCQPANAHGDIAFSIKK